MNSGEIFVSPISLAVYATNWALSLISWGGAHGVMVIVTGYGHGDTSSIPGQDWLHFT